MKFLLRKGATMNHQNMDGNTVLHFCYAHGRPVRKDNATTLVLKERVRVKAYDTSLCLQAFVTPEKHLGSPTNCSPLASFQELGESTA